jgi:DNA-binding GntR family transcriptional regulator
VLNKTLGERILEKLKDDILTGVYKPGERLLYTEIASKLGVSMTPVKEALLRLEQEGIVTSISRKGTYVTGITDRDINEYTRIRLALECLAVDIICEKKIPPQTIQKLEDINAELQKAIQENRMGDCIAKDIEFHTSIVKMSDNRRLIDLINLFPLTNVQSLRGADNIMIKLGSLVVKMHADIISALCQRNARKAKKYLRTNILTPPIEEK